MAANRDRLAAVLAYQAEKRRRLAEYVPTIDQTEPVRPSSAGLGTNLENLSSGIGQGIVNQLEGVKSLVTDPVGTAKAAYEGVKGVVRNPAVLAEALRQTGQKAMSGPLGAGEVIGEMIGPMRGKPPVMQEIDVYHGSPHRFEEFDASKIGTGEGAQAYGHGIYLAESPRVAKDYQIATSRDRFLTDNGFFDPSQLEHLNVRVKARSGDLDAAIETAKKFGAPDEDYPETAAKAARDLERLEAVKARGGMRPNPGNFYTADLPDEMVDRMLDWDKPLSEQPESVRKAVQQINAEFAVPYAKLDEPLGFYVGKLGDAVGGHANASKLMASYGVPGIRYLDAGSRGQGGSGTRNFVVFPGEEKKVKILKRE